jgi:PTH1 family peptidyl-tRNA hydrolase
LKLIVGFGNPGEEYFNNRQNIGFKVVDILGNNENIDIRVKKKKSIIGRGKISGEDVVLLKPQTFVTLIGESVLYIASFLRINVRDIICVLEDSSLPLGEIRVESIMSKLKHPGIESMTKALKSDRFAKVRIGIGYPHKGITMEEHLLNDFSDDENFILIDVLNKAEEVVRMLISHSIEEIQNKYNPEGALKIKKRQLPRIRIRNKHFLLTYFLSHPIISIKVYLITTMNTKLPILITLLLSFFMNSYLFGQNYKDAIHQKKFSEALTIIQSKLDDIYSKRSIEKQIPTTYVAIEKIEEGVDLQKIFSERKIQPYFIENNDTLYALHADTALCYQNIYKYHEALQHYFQALRFTTIGEKDHTIFYSIAQIFKKINKFNAYVLYLEEAYEIKPDNYDYSLELSLALSSGKI